MRCPPFITVSNMEKENCVNTVAKSNCSLSNNHSILICYSPVDETKNCKKITTAGSTSDFLENFQISSSGHSDQRQHSATKAVLNYALGFIKTKNCFT